MRPEQRTQLQDGELWCRRPRWPCLLRLAPSPVGGHAGAEALAAVGAMCQLPTTKHSAVTHYLRVNGTDEEGQDLTPRLAQVLGLDCAVAQRVAEAVAGACPELLENRS